MKTKNFSPLSTFVVPILTIILPETFKPMDPLTKIWLFSISIVITMAILTVWFIINNEKHIENKNREKKIREEREKEIQKVVQFILSKNPSLFNDYMDKLKERKHSFSDKDWDYFNELNEIDRINKLPVVSW